MPGVAKEETMDSTDSTLDEIVSSSCINFCLYIKNFELVFDFLDLGIQLKFYRSFFEESYIFYV